MKSSTNLHMYSSDEMSYGLSSDSSLNWTPLQISLNMCLDTPGFHNTTYGVYLYIYFLLHKLALVENSNLEIEISKSINFIISPFVVLFTFALSNSLLEKVHLSVSCSGWYISKN